MLGDGSPAPVGTADEDLFYPCCFRDGSEIRPATDGEQRRPAPALIGAAGTGLICSAVLTTDPVGGYPPGTPDALTRLSRTGAAHNLAAVPLFVGLPAAALVCGWRSWRASGAGSGSTARPPPLRCWPPWRWPLPASASHPGWSMSADCSSAPASSPASPGIQPCRTSTPPCARHLQRQARRGQLIHHRCKTRFAWRGLNPGLVAAWGKEPALSHQRVSQWENGADVPSPRYLDALCRLYSSRPDKLGFGNDYGADFGQPEKGARRRSASLAAAARRLGAHHPDGRWRAGLA